MIVLALENQKAIINAGELVNYEVNGYEFIHQKGSPGWGSSDTEMFPIIGPTAKANYQVNTPKGIAFQDQHGLLREMDYVVKKQSNKKLVVTKEYKSNTKIINSKYPEKSKVENLNWPYDFIFEKAFELKKDGLHITFSIQGEEGMPFMLGYHPAFKIRTQSALVKTKGLVISIPEVMKVGSRALQLPNCTQVTLMDQEDIKINTSGFGHFMLWTEVDNMLCIEPITFYPYEVEQIDLNKGFQLLKKNSKTFKIELLPVKLN